jgi:membrane protein implicated in regulation of membrane protease activity
MIEAGFADTWLWLVFVLVGLGLVLLELIVGIETGLDLVFIGSVFILGGLATWPVHAWVITIIAIAVLCVAYVALGRRYVHRRILVREERTNVDAMLGRTGIVMRDIARNVDGLVKVGNEEWRARAEEGIGQGEEIVVTGVTGATLTVRKAEGGDRE